MKNILAFLLALMVAQQAIAFADTSFIPSVQTALFHAKVDAIQQSLLSINGLKNEEINDSLQTQITSPFTISASLQIDSVQRQIEYTDTNNNSKIRYLRGFAEMLSHYYRQLSIHKTGRAQLPVLVSSFQEALTLHLQQQSIFPALEKYHYPVGQLLIKNMAFENNPGLQASKEWVFLKLLADRPDEVMKELFKDNSYSYADSLIVVAARRVPEDIFTSAQAKNTILGQKVLALAETDPLIKLIADLANLQTGQMYLPFLDRLYNKELSQKDIAAVIDDPAIYYKLLVETELEYTGNKKNGLQPAAGRPLTAMLKQKSNELYVNVINGLHESPDAVRFKSVQNLNTQELYYLIVMNEETIYTSSYVYVYKRMFEKMPVKSSDSLLQLVRYDRYKKFVTMAANYNMLGDFLGKMNKANSSAIMVNFVNNLDNGKQNDDIEDAVDVANAYSTINQAAIKAIMLQQVTINYNNAITAGNKRAFEIYRIEKLIMESDAGKLNLVDSLGIPPVYTVKNSFLQDSLGRITMQMFFYDDGSGKGDFEVLMRLFSNRKNWAIAATPEWVGFTSLQTKMPFTLFANRPLDGEYALDEKAQKSLASYLLYNGINPSLTVHRGHSFSLKYTIQKMPAATKVVVLGSCGAYQNLADILKVAPEAYIISSKQVGYAEINVPIFMYLVEHLKNGDDINWAIMQKTVSGRVRSGKRQGFADYVFPHQNLGALFIKAYKLAREQYVESYGN